MLASPPVRAAGERFAGPGPLLAAAAAVCFSALFFSGGFDDTKLVWIGGLALGLAALLAAAVLMRVLPAPRVDGATAAFVGCLLGLAVWMGASTIWSISPDRSWSYTNRTLVYAAFALGGLLLSALLPRPAPALAATAAALLGLVFGWALLAKCVPALYPDYGRVARLRSPVGYWNELALLGAVAVPVALWLAAPPSRSVRARACGVLLLFGATLTTLLTYSRFGIALAILAAVAWVLVEGDRVESLAAIVLGGGAGAAVFGAALALPGITKDGQARSIRAHDGWIFALVVVGAAVLVVAATRLAAPRRVEADARRRIERIVAIAALALALAGLAVALAFAGRIWHAFTNPVSSQLSNSPGHLTSASSSNRWRWWQEEWHAFTGHPGGGTGAGTFELTDKMLRNSPLVTTEPHNVPLQMLGETGIVGFLLFVAAIAAAAVGVARAHARETDRGAVTALAVGLAAFVAHMVVDFDWNFVATCGPLLFVAGGLVTRPATEPVRIRRPLLAVGAVLFAVVAVYSLAAPWLAQRQLASALTVADAEQAHTYDPLSTQVLEDWAALEDASGNILRAQQLYEQAVSLEPENSDTWFELGAFYWYHHAWDKAYAALSRSWADDRYGPAGKPCGLLDQARHKALGVWPASCPGGVPAATP
jgi:O-antigen ligase/polysaccharide polymerase Wzy-like membrane protein